MAIADKSKRRLEVAALLLAISSCVVGYVYLAHSLYPDPRSPWWARLLLDLFAAATGTAITLLISLLLLRDRLREEASKKRIESIVNAATGPLVSSASETIKSLMQDEASSMSRQCVDSIRSALIRPIEEIQPDEIASTLERARLNADQYTYIGNTGSHFTSVTLPSLGEMVRSRNISISVQIADPRDTPTVQTLASAKKISADRMRTHLLSSAVLTWFHGSAHPNFSMDRLHLRSSFIQIRVDLTTELALLSTEPKEHPAIRISRGHFYDQVRAQCELTFKGDRQFISFQSVSPPPGRLNDLTQSAIARFLKEAELLVPGVAVLDVLHEVQNRSNPYGRG